jgi:DNA-binding Lrp family transcriptional regulator
VDDITFSFSELDLESTRPMTEASQRTGLSAETLRRRYRKYVRQLSQRRQGMQLKHILAIARGELQPSG